MSAVRFRIEDAEVRRVLTRLPPRLNETLRKSGIRGASRRFVGALQDAWRSAHYNGKGLTRKAIAQSIKLDGPKRRGSGPSAPLTFQIGVDYAAKRGRGRQRVWHLLESGFRHKGARRRIPGSFRSAAWARRNAAPLGTAIQSTILAIAKEALR